MNAKRYNPITGRIGWNVKENINFLCGTMKIERFAMIDVDIRAGVPVAMDIDEDFDNKTFDLEDAVERAVRNGNLTEPEMADLYEISKTDTFRFTFQIVV